MIIDRTIIKKTEAGNPDTSGDKIIRKNLSGIRLKIYSW